MLTSWDNRDQSVWLETAPPCPDAPPLKGEINVDVAVVGAGYTGASTALHLAEQGKNVALLDAREPGWGASGRSAGWLSPHWFFDCPPEAVVKRLGEKGRRLNGLVIETARDLIPALVQRYNFNCDYQATGHVHSSLGLRKQKELETEAQQWAEYGARTSVMDAAQISECVPSGRYKCAIRFGDAGLVNPLAYVRELARAAQDQGAKLHGQSPVEKVEQAGDRWRLTTPTGSVLADQVLLSTNAYEQGLWPKLSKSFARWTVAFVSTDPLPDKGAHLLPRDGGFIDLDYTNMLSLRVDRDGRLGTSTSALMRPNADPAKVAAAFTRKFKRIFPGEPLPPWRYVHTGHTAMNPAIVPRLYSLAPGLYAANAYNANGIILATLMGREVAGLMTTGDAEACAYPVNDLKPMRGAGAMAALGRYVLHPAGRLRSWVG